MAGERTEAPTTRRRQDVRRCGQVARSHDLTTAVGLLAALFGLRLFLGAARDQAVRLVISGIEAVGRGRTDSLPWSAATVAAALASLLAPLFVFVFAVVLLSGFAQGGMLFAPRLLRPQASRLNPIAGARRIVSVNGLVQSGRTLAKFALVTLIGALVLMQHATELANLGALDLASALGVLASVAWGRSTGCGSGGGSCRASA